MTMGGEGVWRTAADQVQAAGLHDGLAVWDFQWVEESAPEQWAQVTGRLRWRGFDIGFALDGLLGVDGRLAAPSLATIPAGLQHLVLQHFAAECLLPLKGGPLADMTLVSLQWHETPLPMEGEFEFMLKRAELSRFSRGRLTVFHEAGRQQLLNALAALRWPVPHGLSTVNGRLQIGAVHLTPDECASLEVGDLVWLDDAEVAPTGLRAQFMPIDSADAPCWLWIKRSVMTLQSSAMVGRERVEDAAAEAAMTLTATSPDLSVQRAWLQGAMPQQSLTRTALALMWQLRDGARVRYEGQLIVVGRRLGLRVARVL